MDAKTFSLVAGVIFAAVALFHLVRIFMEWTVIIGDWSIPMWVSWIALVVAGGQPDFWWIPISRVYTRSSKSTAASQRATYAGARTFSGAALSIADGSINPKLERKEV